MFLLNILKDLLNVNYKAKCETELTQQTFVLVKTYQRCLEDVFSVTLSSTTASRRLQDAFKT